MHQPSEFADKVGVPAFNFKIINFFLSIKIVLPFYTIPFFIFGLYVILFGEVGGIFPAFFGVKRVFGGSFNGFAFQLYLYGGVCLLADNDVTFLGLFCHWFGFETITDRPLVFVLFFYALLRVNKRSDRFGRVFRCKLWCSKSL